MVVRLTVDEFLMNCTSDIHEEKMENESKEVFLTICFQKGWNSPQLAILQQMIKLATNDCVVTWRLEDGQFLD